MIGTADVLEVITYLVIQLNIQVLQECSAVYYNTYIVIEWSEGC